MSRMAKALKRPLSAEALSRAGWPLLSLVVVVALWQVAAVNNWLGEFILPKPGDVVSSFSSLLTEGVLWDDIAATLWEAWAGFVVGAVVGIALALGAGLSSAFRKAVYPYVIAIHVTPVIAIAPIVIAWLGFGYTPKIAIVALIVFFPVFINTLTGLMSTDDEAEEMLRSLRATTAQKFLHLRVPNAAPFVFAGLKLGVTVALIGAVVAEFISAEKGLGVLVSRFSYALNMDDAYAVLLTLTILGLVLFAVIEIVDRAVVFWTRDSRTAGRSRRRAKRERRRLGDLTEMSEQELSGSYETVPAARNR